MDLGLKGLKAVLAGATKGIGRATAELLAEEGCDVAVCARDASGVEGTLKSLSDKGVKAVGRAVDLKDADDYRAWVVEAAEQLGGCDLFISFASAGGPPASEESWRAGFELDLMGTYRGIDAALPYLERSNAASIVSVGTIVAIEPSFGPQPYAALKAAVTHYAGALAQSLAAKKIRVNSVSPGPIFVEGGAWDNIKRNRPEFYEATAAKVPLGRLGQPEEVARVIAFLASPLNGFVTGTNVVVDGGMTRRIQF